MNVWVVFEERRESTSLRVLFEDETVESFTLPPPKAQPDVHSAVVEWPRPKVRVSVVDFEREEIAVADVDFRKGEHLIVRFGASGPYVTVGQGRPVIM